MRRAISGIIFCLLLAVGACGGEPGDGGSGDGGGTKNLPDTAEGEAVADGSLYKHPLGYRFRYPKDWKLVDTGQDLLTLVPPDVRKNEQGPTEAFLVLGGPAEGVTDPTDPAMVAQAEQIVAANFPFFTREGEPAKGTHGGRPSLALTWAGKAPTGVEFRARMYVAIEQDAAFSVTAIVPKDAFASRVDAVEAIFASFHWVKPPVEAALVGQWRNEDTYFSGEFSATTVRYMGLLADGRATWGSQLNAGMNHSDSEGRFTGSTSGNSSGGDTSRGKWTAAGTKLHIVWDGGSEEEFEYYIEGASLMLTPTDGGKRKLWQRVR